MDTSSVTPEDRQASAAKAAIRAAYPFFWIPALAGIMLVSACSPRTMVEEAVAAPLVVPVNTAHLEHLSEDVVRGGDTLRIVHIYADAPTYAWVADDDEGAACVDDAARAAVFYLRQYAYTGDERARQNAKKLLAFVRYMQADNGLFYNFVWSSTLRINTQHENSVADEFSWWAARAVWALGEGARVLKESDPELASGYAAAVRRTYPYLDALLARHGETVAANGFTFPAWLVYESAGDATSELLLGLVGLHEAYPDATLQQRIDTFAAGLETMRLGDMQTLPYGGFASYSGGWHGWGNSQTMALAGAGRTREARLEADQFFSFLLTDGWLHSLDYATRSPRHFEQIAYAVRAMSVGLVRLYEQTNDTRYAVMAGLAASWLTGNNAAGTAMYDPATGRGYDGINDSTTVNYNSGAESTIEALMTILEVGRHEQATAWINVQAAPPGWDVQQGDTLRYRVFTAPEGRRIALVRNLARGTTDILEGDALSSFLQN